jgi:hypothetical protein
MSRQNHRRLALPERERLTSWILQYYKFVIVELSNNLFLFSKPFFPCPFLECLKLFLTRQLKKRKLKLTMVIEAGTFT